MTASASVPGMIAPLTRMPRFAELLAPAVSSTSTAKLEVATAVGVPVRSPAELSDKPAGSEPDATFQLNVPLPPLA